MRAERNHGADTNPTTSVGHSSMYGSGECLGIKVTVFCEGCNELHQVTFRCPEHGGPAEPAPCWDGDPHSDPFTAEPSLLSLGRLRCHSYIRGGRWEYLADSEHELAGQTVPLGPLPDWLVDAQKE